MRDPDIEFSKFEVDQDSVPDKIADFKKGQTIKLTFEIDSLYEVTITGQVGAVVALQPEVLSYVRVYFGVRVIYSSDMGDLVEGELLPQVRDLIEEKFLFLRESKWKHYKEAGGDLLWSTYLKKFKRRGWKCVNQA